MESVVASDANLCPNTALLIHGCFANPTFAVLSDRAKQIPEAKLASSSLRVCAEILGTALLSGGTESYRTSSQHGSSVTQA